MDASVLDALRVPHTQAVALVAIGVGCEMRAGPAPRTARVQAKTRISCLDRDDVQADATLRRLTRNVIAAIVPAEYDTIWIVDRAATIARPQSAVAAGLRARDRRGLVDHICKSWKNADLSACQAGHAGMVSPVAVVRRRDDAYDLPLASPTGRTGFDVGKQERTRGKSAEAEPRHK